MPPSWTALFGGTNIAPAIPGFLQLNISANTQLGWPIEANATSPIAAPIIEVNASAPALTVQLADARQVSDGSALLFNNVGANTFTVLDAQGNTLAAIASGQVWQLYLADNSTLQGTWRVFQFGAGVSNANASALAGLGLKAISTTLNEHIVINQQVASYNIQSTDRAACVEWVGGSGGVFTGPSPAGVGADWFCYIKNAGTGTLTFNPPSGTVDGGASKSFNPNDSCILICDGTNFITLGFGQAVASSFNFVQIGVTGGNLVLSGAQLNRVSYKFTGVLTSNQTITVPASIQQYWVDNETTGAFTLTVTAGAGATVAVSQGQRAILYCDGTNIVNAVSGSAAPTFPDGTAAAPSITFTSDLTLGLYKAGVDVLGFATAGVARGSISAVGAWTINAPSSGTTLQVNTTVSLQAAITVSDGTVTSQWQSTGAAAVWGTTGNFIAGIFTNNSTRLQISGSGNTTINAPTSGVTLTANVTSGLVANFASTGASTAVELAITAAGNTGGSTSLSLVQDSASNAYVYNRAAASLLLGSGNATRVSINSIGNVTISAPSSGVTLTAIGTDRIVVLNTPAAATNSLLRYQENGVSKFSAGWNTGIGYIIYDDPASAYRLIINPSGNWTIGVPSSGVALTVNGTGTLQNPAIRAGSGATSGDILLSGVYGFGSLFNIGSLQSSGASTIGYGVAPQTGAAGYQSTTAVSVPRSAISLGEGSSNVIAFYVAPAQTTAIGTAPTSWQNAMNIGTGGNVTINAPTSGDSLSIATLAGGNHAIVVSGAASGLDGRSVVEFNATLTTSKTWDLGIDTLGGTAKSFDIRDVTRGALPFSISTTGTVAIAAPSSGASLTVAGAANAYTAIITASSTASQSFGVQINAGTNTSDVALEVNNQTTATNYLVILGNGESAILQQPGFALQNSTTFDIGYVDIPQNLQNATYATVATDRGKSIDHTSASAHTYTINDASVNYPVGTAISFDNNGAGIVTISVQTTPANLIWGPSGATGNRFLAQNGVATARKIAAGAPGTWRITGVGLS